MLSRTKTPAQHAIWKRIDDALAYLSREVATAAERERVAVYDLFLLVYDQAALKKTVQPLFKEVRLAAPLPGGLAAIVVSAEHGPLLLSAVGLPALPALADGPGIGMGALLRGTGLTTWLRWTTKGATAA